MSESKNKLKGCRASSVVIQDFSNTLAAYGAAQYRIFELNQETARLGDRLAELQKELAAARAQEPTAEAPAAAEPEHVPEFKVAE